MHNTRPRTWHAHVHLCASWLVPCRVRCPCPSCQACPPTCTFQIFRATGINDKFQWCGIGFSQLPNGLGFGGAQGAGNMGQFALYVDASLDGGMSRPIATFGNDPLGAEQVFQVGAWCLGTGWVCKVFQVGA